MEVVWALSRVAGVVGVAKASVLRVVRVVGRVVYINKLSQKSLLIFSEFPKAIDGRGWGRRSKGFRRRSQNGSCPI